jgi:hypothetical protein
MHAALAAHAACECLSTLRYFGSQPFAQRLEQGVYGEVITQRAVHFHAQLLHLVCPVELVAVAVGCAGLPLFRNQID